MSGEKRWIIESRGLTKNYGKLTALDSIDFKVPYGPVGLLGPNGAGKTTLIKCLLGLLRATSGNTYVFGYKLDSKDSILNIRQRIGYMPESDCFIPEMDAVWFVKYMAELSGLPAMDSMQRTHEVLDYIGIGDERYRKIKTYSTGMKQKVKLAQAIVHDPELIFLDEPTNGMDPKGRKEMLDLIRDISINHGKNVIFSSHLLQDVEYICQHVVIMNQGKVLVQGGLGDLLNTMKKYEIRIKGDQKEFGDILRKLGLEYERSGSFFMLKMEKDILNRIYRSIDTERIQIRHASISKRTLEDIFVDEINRPGGGVS